MSFIGEASAALGVVQVGFSLARTLNTYIGDYKDSRDSIIALASELDATIIQVQELNSLVASNEAAKSLGDGSRKLAEKCIQDSDRLIKKLVELLTKARLPENPNAIVNIKPEDIIVDKLTRAYWPLVKPQVDVVKSELHVMKTDILIARSCIQAQSASTPADRDANEASIVALAKSRKLARQILRKAKAKERRSVKRRYRDLRTGSDISIPGTDSSGSESEKNLDLIAGDLRKSILEDLKKEEVAQRAQQTADEEARKAAVEAYQDAMRLKLAQLHMKTETTQQQMKEIFGNAIDDSQLKKFLDQQQSQQMQDEFGEMLLKFGVGTSLPSKNPDSRTNSGKRGTSVSKRRWFSHRTVSRPSQLNNPGIDYSASVGLNPSLPNRTRFLHLALSYDSAEGRYIHQVLDNSALPHLPCGPSCDLKTTISTWQAVPQSVKQSAAAWVKDNFSDRVWQLHSAVSTARNSGNMRRMFQRLVLGTVVHNDMTGTLLVFSSTEDTQGSERAGDPHPATKPDVGVPIPDTEKPPINFKDAVGRKFTFPWSVCKNWKGMEGLIRQAFVHVDVVGQHVMEGHYDLMGPDGEIILPQVWDATVKPDWDVSMHMWPIPELKPPEPVVEKHAFEVPIDQNVDSFMRGNTHGGPDPFSNIAEFTGAGPSKSSKINSRKRSKNKAAKIPDVILCEGPGSGFDAMPPEPVAYLPDQRVRPATDDPAHPGPRRRPQQSAMVAWQQQSKPKKKKKKELSGFAAWMAGQKPKPTKRHDQYSYTGPPSSLTDDESFASCDPGPDEILQEASDVEDAMLSDEQLKRKMMRKYAGDTVTSHASAPVPDKHVSIPDTDPEAVDEGKAERRSSAASAPEVLRQAVTHRLGSDDEDGASAVTNMT